MTEAISGDGAAVAPGGGFEDEDDNDSHYSRDSHSLDTMDEAPNLTNNVRIKSRRFLREYEVDDDADNLEASADQVAQVNAAAASSGEGNVTGGVGTANMAGGGGGGGNGATAGMGGGQLGGDDAKVPSRVAVKKLSAQVSLEAKRKEEMEVRRKK